MRAMNRLLFSFTALAVFAGLAGMGLWAAPAHAQDQELPSFKLPSVITPQEVEGLSIDFDEAFNTIENPYLSDTIKLQYQISLIEKLVERQAALKQINESYASLGIKYDAPPPPRGICAQLPSNAPCLEAYPNLYGSLADERRAHYAELKAKADAAIAAAQAAANRASNAPVRKEGETDEEAAARAKKEAAARKARNDAIERKNRYRWTEVSCLTGDCRGVLVKARDTGYRVTVRPGSRLPDGTVVQQVSTKGIRVSIMGDVINVRPAPGDAGEDADGASAASNPDAPQGGQQGTPTPLMNAMSVVAGGESGDSASGADENASGGTGGEGGNAAGNQGGGGNPGGGAATASASTGGTGAGSNAGSGQAVSQSPLGPSGLF